MKILKTKTFIGFASFTLGLATMFAAQKVLTHTPVQTESPAETSQAEANALLDHFFTDDFFGRSQDPFEDMRKMRAKMFRQFAEEPKGEGLFDSWYKKKFGGGTAAEIQKREDDKFVYYDISIAGINPSDLKVKVEGGQITVSGKEERKTENGGSGSYFSSTFHRSFPIPFGVDESHVEMENAQKGVTLKFPKTKT